jgi:hypothetical protein
VVGVMVGVVVRWWWWCYCCYCCCCCTSNKTQRNKLSHLLGNMEKYCRF